MSRNYHSLPPECDGVNPCDNEACQRAIAETHIIPEAAFNGRIKTAAGQPKVYTASQMQAILAGGSCEQDLIVLDQNLMQNAQLDPRVAQDAGGFTAYSYLTLKGILSQGAESFSFYLATGNGGVGNDVIFSVEFGTASTQFYDTSQVYP